MLALMFLKIYEGCSDRKLIYHLNRNIEFQMFCGIFLGKEDISNFKVVCSIRSELSRNLNIKVVQNVLAGYWNPYLNQTDIMLEDATCYETSMRYQTNANRKNSTAAHIVNNFKRKGRAGKHEEHRLINAK